MKIASTLLLLLFFILGAQSPYAPEHTHRRVTYEIYALSYGTYPGFPVSALINGADKNRKIDLQMMIWLLKGSNGKRILVDTGCYRDTITQLKGIKNFIKPSDTLVKVGLSANDITDVIVSHMPWDHADGIDLFPNAKIGIQKEEYDYYTGAAWQPGGKHGGIEPDDVLTLVRLNTQQKVNLIDGDDREIIDGIRVHTDNGTAVIASDNMYLYENLDKHAPIAQTFDADSNIKAQDRMKQIASRADLIIPGHDPPVFVN